MRERKNVTEKETEDKNWRRSKVSTSIDGELVKDLHWEKIKRKTEKVRDEPVDVFDKWSNCQYVPRSRCCCWSLALFGLWWWNYLNVILTIQILPQFFFAACASEQKHFTKALNSCLAMKFVHNSLHTFALQSYRPFDWRITKTTKMV